MQHVGSGNVNIKMIQTRPNGLAGLSHSMSLQTETDRLKSFKR